MGFCNIDLNWMNLYQDLKCTYKWLKYKVMIVGYIINCGSIKFKS